MNRKDKEIIDPLEIADILRKATVLRLAMIAGDWPYLTPVCFAVEENALYCHGAAKGLKVTALRENPHVCFEAETDVAVRTGKAACDWSMTYRSVVGRGLAVEITAPAGKRRALDLIMTHYGGEPFDYPEKSLERTTVFRIDIQEMTGKRSG